MKSLLLLALSILSLTAQAQDNGTQRVVEDEILNLRSISVISSRSSDTNAPISCIKRYQKLYAKGKIRIVYAFGYSEANNTVLDHYSYNALITQILRPCQQDTYLCGFKADKEDKTLFRKQQLDANGIKIHKIELKLIKGSITQNNRVNTSERFVDFQVKTCENATKTFQQEISNGADVVFYNGHSRNGGGPDFCPPVLNKNGKVNYTWYQKNQPGLKGLLGAMNVAVKNGTPNSIIGMFSCASKQHFLKKMESVNKNASYILTSRVSNFEEVLRDSIAALDSLLAQRCEDGIIQAFDVRGASVLKNMFP